MDELLKSCLEVPAGLAGLLLPAVGECCAASLPGNSGLLCVGQKLLQQ